MTPAPGRALQMAAIVGMFGAPHEELIGFVAAEANHEPNRRRRQRLDAAFIALTEAAPNPVG
jgi:hypothetical protein